MSWAWESNGGNYGYGFVVLHRFTLGRHRREIPRKIEQMFIPGDFFGRKLLKKYEL
jgi:hypothetical protein